ncbi:MAG TPA: aminotransferase class I/II-fold pyridoxal phosphate-dependent enzyme [Lacunisphaera sp.]|nr:aminotransferase class I/II-fold pyridoxal phosphate-dependent enzyme [Lacunisphaera sp.]
MSSSCFQPLPLGQSIPASPHAVSCSLPTMRSVRGYEEKDPEIVRHLTNGYPRFVIHPFARQLVAHFTASTPALYGRTLWLTSSAAMARTLLAHLTSTRGAELYTQHGLCGVSHPESPETHALAKVFLQNIGGFLSSREAEDHLVALGLLPAPHPEDVFKGDGPPEIRRQLRTALPGTSDGDLILANCGMSVVYAAFRAVNALQAPRGRTIWLQLGWLYLDTIAILRKFTAQPGDYVYVRDVTDLEALTRIFAAHGARIAGVVAEVPTNPLLQTPDLPAIAALCRQHGAHLLVDPSMSSLFALNVLPHADVVISSLTKYTASEGDLTAGLAVINSAGPDAAALRKGISAVVEPLYARDAARLAWQIGHTREVLAKIQASTPQVVAFLQNHPAVKDVFWALHPASRDNYLKLARSPEATGGMITFTLREIGGLEKFYDRLRLPKGPSFGMKATLICPFMYLAHYDLVTTPAGLAELAASKLDPDLLRLCVGTEPVEEIIAALREALG